MRSARTSPLADLISQFLKKNVKICQTTVTVLYFGMFTPIALITKLLGKDLLDERWDKNATTYWVKRSQTTFDPKSAENMF